MAEVLGEGTFGIVKRAQNEKTKERVAIKIVPKKNLSNP